MHKRANEVNRKVDEKSLWFFFLSFFLSFSLFYVNSFEPDQSSKRFLIHRISSLSAPLSWKRKSFFFLFWINERETKIDSHSKYVSISRSSKWLLLWFVVIINMFMYSFFFFFGLASYFVINKSRELICEWFKWMRKSWAHLFIQIIDIYF